MLRFVTYLVPVQLYRDVADDLAARLEMPVTFEVNHASSGPLPSTHNPFAEGRVDLGFVCGESYLRRLPNVALLGAAPVYDDARNQGEPVYFSELMVRRDSPHAQRRSVQGARLVYNDVASLSGWTSVLDYLAQRSLTTAVFSSVGASGSHARSLRMLLDGTADVAAIDATVLRSVEPQTRERLVSLETLGPYPAQPAVVRADLDASLVERIRSAVLTMHERHPEALSRGGVRRFAPVDQRAFDDVARRLDVARELWREVRREMR